MKKFLINTLDLLSFALREDYLTAWFFICAVMFSSNLIYFSDWCSVKAWYVTAIWYVTIPSILLRPELWYRYFRNRWLKEHGKDSIELKCAKMLTGKGE